ncbi:MAG: vitamin K epoxide reductase family protein [Peptococcaceae bacterium]|nr:vitamin K epoxide reductase family protein [Peptococcaceae bacterium]
MVGLFYLLVSLGTLVLWRMEPQLCVTEVCNPGLLGRSWYLWGALFYAVAGFLCIALQKNRATGVFLIAGAVFHAGLIGYGYFTTGTVCPVCWKIAVMGALLAAAYWFLPAWGIKRAAGFPAAPAIIALALLVSNPSAPYRVDSYPMEIAGASIIEKPGGEYRNQDGKSQVSKNDDGNSRSRVTGWLPPGQEDGAIQNPDSGRFLLVKTPSGGEASLDLSKRPALFFAAWCPHCDGALREAAKKKPEERPYLVVTYLQNGDVEKVKDKLAENGLSGMTYYLAEKPPADVQGVPALVGQEGQ